MKSFLNLGIINDHLIPANVTKDIVFKEFCNNLDSLGIIVDPELYLEAVVDKSKGFKKSAGTIIRNTKDTTSSTVGMYRDVTDAGGAGVKGVWDLVMSAVGLISKITIYIVNKIFALPGKISKLIDSIGNVPTTVRNKIKGNIKLYITAKDLSYFYNNIFPSIRNFINNADQMSKGDSWVTLFSILKEAKKDISKLSFTKTDLKCGDYMKKEYKLLKKIEFSPTTIDMSDSNNVDIYFGMTKLIDFVDLTGKQHKCSYYDALIQLFKDIGSFKDELNHIRESIGGKYEASQMNQSLSNLSPDVQKRIADTVMMISKVINIIGNLVRYVLIDMNTIETSTNKLLNKGKIMLGDPTTGKPRDVDTKNVPKSNKDI